MTTIAWDGKTLAADRAQFQSGIVIGETIKIDRRDDGALIGSSGCGALGAGFRRWFLDGEKGDRPSLGVSGDMAEVLVIRPDGRVERYNYSGWFEVTSQFAALGGGQEIALGAMEAGASAVRAVGIATRRVGGDPDRIDAFDLDPQPLRLVQP